MADRNDRPDPASSSGDTSTASPGADAAARLTEQALADLTDRLDVDPGQVRAVEAQQVTWRDSSLGCPQPGMIYQQVLTEGVRIVLELDGRRYEYHSGGGHGPYLCERPKPPFAVHR
jgi:hypothetical protein